MQRRLFCVMSVQKILIENLLIFPAFVSPGNCGKMWVKLKTVTYDRVGLGDGLGDFCSFAFTSSPTNNGP